MPDTSLGRVLIVDDEVELQTSMVRSLNRQGYEAQGISSGIEALKALREQNFDLLLSDLMMPEMDGIQLLNEVGSLEAPEDVVVQALSEKSTMRRKRAGSRFSGSKKKPLYTRSTHLEATLRL